MSPLITNVTENERRTSRASLITDSASCKTQPRHSKTRSLIIECPKRWSQIMGLSSQLTTSRNADGTISRNHFRRRIFLKAYLPFRRANGGYVQEIASQDAKRRKRVIRTFLRTYRTTPTHSLDRKTPAEMFTGRKFRELPREPTNNIAATQTSKHQKEAKKNFDRHRGAKERSFVPNVPVYVQMQRDNKQSRNRSTA